MSELRLCNLTKTYGSSLAVSGVNLDIREGEFVVFLGPSGCGKTTTLRMVAGFIAPTTGRIELNGKDITGIHPRKRNIGMVFQNYALFPNMTVAENVAFGLERRRRPRQEVTRRVTEMLELVGLTHRTSAYCHELSGGQQQRVALARALAYSPDILLLDEPFGALDVKLRDSMQIEVRKIQKATGITTIFVTHDQTEAMILADRVVVMNGGQVQQVGPPDDVYRRPANSFVAGFVGKNNFFFAEVVGHSPNGLTVRIDGQSPLNIHAATTPCELGHHVTFCVRPETICFADCHTNCALVGTVRSRTFLGNLVIYEIDLGGENQLLTVETSSEFALRDVGEVVHLAFSSSSAVVFAG